MKESQSHQCGKPVLELLDQLPLINLSHTRLQLCTPFSPMEGGWLRAAGFDPENGIGIYFWKRNVFLAWIHFSEQDLNRLSSFVVAHNGQRQFSSLLVMFPLTSLWRSCRYIQESNSVTLRTPCVNGCLQMQWTLECRSPLLALHIYVPLPNMEYKCLLVYRLTGDYSPVNVVYCFRNSSQKYIFRWKKG